MISSSTHKELLRMAEACMNARRWIGPDGDPLLDAAARTLRALAESDDGLVGELEAWASQRDEHGDGTRWDADTALLRRAALRLRATRGEEASEPHIVEGIAREKLGRE